MNSFLPLIFWCLLLGASIAAPAIPFSVNGAIAITKILPHKIPITGGIPLSVVGIGFDKSAPAPTCKLTYSYWGARFPAPASEAAKGLVIPARIVNASLLVCITVPFQFPMQSKDGYSVPGNRTTGLASYAAVDISMDGIHYVGCKFRGIAEHGFSCHDLPTSPWYITTYTLISASVDRRPYTDRSEGGYLLVKIEPELHGKRFQVDAMCGGQELLASTFIGRPLVKIPMDLANLPWPSGGVGKNIWDCIGDVTFSWASSQTGDKAVQKINIRISLAPTSKPNQVIIDHGRRSLIVEGAPFVPFGWYDQSNDLLGLGVPFQGRPYMNQYLSRLRSMARQGVNTIMDYGFKNNGDIYLNDTHLDLVSEFLDGCHEIGIYVQVCMPGFAGIFDCDPMDAHKCESRRNHWLKYMKLVSQKPAFLGYYIGDDTVDQDMKRFNDSYAWIRSHDPWHPCFASISEGSVAWAYPFWYDVAMIESYNGESPSMAAVSAYAIGSHPNEWMPNIVSPMTFGSSASWANLEMAIALAYGLNGNLVFIHSLAQMPTFEASINELGMSLQELLPSITAPFDPDMPFIYAEVVHGSVPTSMGFGEVKIRVMREHSGCVHILACNTFGDMLPKVAIKIAVEGATVPSMAQLPFEYERWGAVINITSNIGTVEGHSQSEDPSVGYLIDWFPPQSCHIYRLNSSRIPTPPRPQSIVLTSTPKESIHHSDTKQVTDDSNLNMIGDYSAEMPPLSIGYPRDSGWPGHGWTVQSLTFPIDAFVDPREPQAFVHLDTRWAVEGRHSIRVTVPKALRDTVGLYPPIPALDTGYVTLSEGQVYRVTFWARTIPTIVDHALTFMLCNLTKDGSMVKTPVMTVLLFPLWTERSFIYKAPMGGFLVFQSSASPYWLDAVNVIKVSKDRPPQAPGGSMQVLAIPIINTIRHSASNSKDYGTNATPRAIPTAPTANHANPCKGAKACITRVSPSSGPTTGCKEDVIVYGHGFDTRAKSPKCRVSCNYLGYSWGSESDRVVSADVIDSTTMACRCPSMLWFNGSYEIAGKVTFSVSMDGIRYIGNSIYAPALFSYYKIFDIAFDKKPYTTETKGRLLLTVNMPSWDQLPDTLYIHAAYRNGKSFLSDTVVRSKHSTFSVDLPSVAIDTMIYATLTLGYRGPNLANAAVRLLRIGDSRPNQVILDHSHRSLLVRGKPFLGVGWFMMILDYDVEEAIRRAVNLAKRGTNSIVPYQIWQWPLPQAKAFMDVCASVGLFVQFDVYVLVYYLTSIHPLMRKNMDYWNKLTQHIEAFRDHPALLGWYVADDTTFYNRDNMIITYEYIKSLDPYHPIFVSLAGFREAYKYQLAYDIGMPESYPQIWGRGPVTDTIPPVTIMQEYPFTWAPLWVCGQGFQPIRAEELRAQMYASLVHGATGMMWFYDDVEAETTRWRLLEESNRVAMEVLSLAPSILNPPSSTATLKVLASGEVPNQGPEYMAAGVWQDPQGCIHVALLNMGDPTRATVTLLENGLSFDVGEGTAPFERQRKVVTKDGIFHEYIQGMSTLFYEFNCTYSSNAVSSQPSSLLPISLAQRCARRNLITINKTGPCMVESQSESNPKSVIPRKPYTKTNIRSNANMVTNPSFEADTMPGDPDWWVLAPYVGYPMDPMAHMMLDSQVYRSGRRSLKLVSTKWGKGAALLSFPGASVSTSIPQGVDVTFWARVDTVSSKAPHLVNILNINTTCTRSPGGYCYGNTNLGNFSLQSDWTRIQLQVKGHNGVIGIQFPLPTIAWIDDVDVHISP